MTSQAASRSAQLRALLKTGGLDALIISSPTNIRYATGFTGSNGTVVVRADSVQLLTDSRYTKWAADEIETHDASTEIVIAPGNGRKALAELLDGANAIGLEAAHISWQDAKSFRADLGDQRIVATTGVVEGLREFKTGDELVALGAAAAIGDKALAQLIDELRPGRSEREVARRLAHHMFEHGGAVPSFDIIVASGPNSAKPHHEPTDRVIESGDLLIIDSGATVDGYRSDMTRSFVFGTPTTQQQEMLEVVQTAQQAGVDAVRPGVAASEIDAICRSVIADAGFGEYFTHGTGHGVGLDIHEAPSVSSASTATLAPGHIITVEPGVYIPEVGGVRWEDTVAVTIDGAEPLTCSPKQPHLKL